MNLVVVVFYFWQEYQKVLHPASMSISIHMGLLGLYSF